MEKGWIRLGGIGSERNELRRIGSERNESRRIGGKERNWKKNGGKKQIKEIGLEKIHYEKLDGKNII